MSRRHARTVSTRREIQVNDGPEQNLSLPCRQIEFSIKLSIHLGCERSIETRSEISLFLNSIEPAHATLLGRDTRECYEITMRYHT